MLIAFLRHASTAWNADRRMQGHADIALDSAGRAEAATWRLPADLHERRRADPRRELRPHGGQRRREAASLGGSYEPIEWISSPLGRAIETATIIGGRTPRIEPALIEMDWGEWEGARLDDLQARYGEAFAANARRGLDFRPPGGESPRDVMTRVARWLASLDMRGPPIVAVSHNGVLRALLAIATGWDMTGKPPVKLQPAALHRFAVAPGGKLDIVEWNVRLAVALNASRPARQPPAPSKALP
ncbi:MAG TPA: histidine phosphatase family protein [Casimicrobiaceae bacterium]